MSDPAKFKFYSVEYVPALPGFFVVDDVYEGGFKSPPTMQVGAPIIAWRLTTELRAVEGEQEAFTRVDPITFDGSACGEARAVQNPDMSITVAGTCRYESIADAQANDYRKKAPLQSVAE